MAQLANLKPAFGSLPYTAQLETILETRKLRRAAVQRKQAAKKKPAKKKAKALPLPTAAELKNNPELLAELKELLK